MDRMSDLPTEIIRHIGSFLSAKEATFAMVLSKRWRNLFTIIPELCYWLQRDGETFKDFSERVLALPATHRVKKFSMDWGAVYTTADQFDHINRCLLHVLKHHGVYDLEFKLQIDIEETEETGIYYSLPLEVFTCETVAKLTLGSGFVIDFLPANVYLPVLKTLRLDSIRFLEIGRCAFSALLSASPVLEELVIDDVDWEHWKWSFTVCSPTLRRLSIQRENWDDEEISEFERFSLDTPALTYLKCADCVPKEYPFVNLNSVVEAELDLFVERYRLGAEDHKDVLDPMNLIIALKNVEILHLSAATMELIYVFRNVIPVFENLVRLSVGYRHDFWLTSPILLNKSPNLKTLIIESDLHDNRLEEEEDVCPYALSCPVEVLKMRVFDAFDDDLEQMKPFLEKFSCLKLLEVHSYVEGDRVLKIMEYLQNLPRASNDCEIRFVSTW